MLAIEQYGAGPWASLTRRPGRRGDQDREPTRWLAAAARSGRISLRRATVRNSSTFNRNKKSIALDLKHAERCGGVARSERADAVLDNLRGDVPVRLGSTLSAVESSESAHSLLRPCVGLRPRGVTRRLAGNGAEMQAEAGLIHADREPGAPPTKFGSSMIDLAAGLSCALGLLAAVLKARESGLRPLTSTRVCSTSRFTISITRRPGT